MITAIVLFFEKHLHIVSILAILVVLGLFWGVSKDLKIRTLERDQARTAQSMLTNQLAASTAQYNAVVKAYNIKGVQDHDRHQFNAEGAALVAKDRGSPRDGPLAPVAIDTLKRLRVRQAALLRGDTSAHPSGASALSGASASP